MSGAAKLTAAEAVRHAREALAGGEPAVGVTVLEVRTFTEDGPAPGDRMVVWADRHLGTFGDPEIDAEAVRIARQLLDGEGRAGAREIGGGVAAYFEAHRSPPGLVIVGAGHIARPLCAVGALLGFRVTVLDDRPEFATRERFPEAAEVLRADFADPFRGVPIRPDTHLVLVTRGHKYDFEALRHLLRLPRAPAYIGMVGSRRRTRAAMEMLLREGLPPDLLAAVHAPVGLDVGAETPEEIAVSIAAELVLVRRGGSGTPLRDRERVFARWVARRTEEGEELATPDGTGP